MHQCSKISHYITKTYLLANSRTLSHSRVAMVVLVHLIEICVGDSYLCTYPHIRNTIQHNSDKQKVMHEEDGVNQVTEVSSDTSFGGGGGGSGSQRSRYQAPAAILAP